MRIRVGVAWVVSFKQQEGVYSRLVHRPTDTGRHGRDVDENGTI